MSRLKTVAAAVLLAMALTGCGGGLKAPMGVDSGARMQEAKKMAETLIYQNPAVDAKKYTKFILEPVAIYDQEDNDFGDIPQADRQLMADYVRDAFIEAFKGSNFPLVKGPGPGVLRVKFTLVGLTRSVPAAQALNYVMFPIGTGIQIAKGALGKSGTFMGNATLAVEFDDAQSDEVVAALVTKVSANALDFSAAVIGQYGSAKAGIDNFMATVRKSADESHGFATKK